MVEVVTDNRNRAAADVRHCFDKSGGSLGANGCVSYMFDRKGVIVIERTTEIDEDKLMEAALEAGAEDFITEDDAFEIRTEVADFSSVRESLESAGYSFITAELSRIPQTMVENLDEETAQKMMKLLERLEDNDDVQEVFHNAVLPEDDDE